MIDLHLHLDGSLSEEDFIYLAKRNNVDLGNNFPNNIYVPIDCPSLEEYLTRFDLPCALMQDEYSLSYVAESLVKRLNKLGLIYAEIRFAPQLHVLHGLSQYQVTHAVLDGLEKGLNQCPNFEANLILCCMRHASEEVNMETIEVANKFKGTRVVAVDLAGAEALHPSTYYHNIFNRAKEYGLNITIHAGEATGSDEILMALDNGAMRIGHGVHLSIDKKTVDIINSRHICFEFCPTSNLQTKSLRSYEDVPLRKFMENHILVTINSDNMTVSHTDANQEMKQMIKTFNLNEDEVYQLILNSINNSFTFNETKLKLKDKLIKNIHKYYLGLSARS